MYKEPTYHTGGFCAVDVLVGEEHVLVQGVPLGALPLARRVT